MAIYRRAGGVWVNAAFKRRSGSFINAPSVKRRQSGAWIECAIATQLTSRTVSAGAVSPADATIVYATNSDGYIYQSVNGGANTPLEQWKLSGAWSDYQVRATLVSGALSTGTLNTWQNPGAAWGVTRTLNTAGTTQAVITVEIRRVSDSVVVSTATITLQAVVDI